VAADVMVRVTLSLPLSRPSQTLAQAPSLSAPESLAVPVRAGSACLGDAHSVPHCDLVQPICCLSRCPLFCRYISVETCSHGPPSSAALCLAQRCLLSRVRRVLPLRTPCSPARGKNKRIANMMRNPCALISLADAATAVQAPPECKHRDRDGCSTLRSTPSG